MAAQATEKNSHFIRPDVIRNLVCKGGGVKGLSFAGALAALGPDALNLLQYVENVAGTSAGAITALLVCMGHTIQELLDRLDEQDMHEFLDEEGSGPMSVSKERFAKVQNQSWPLQASAANSAAYDIHTRMGMYKTGKISHWLCDLIEEKTKDPNLTFEDLHYLAKDRNSGFKNLFVYAYNMNTRDTVCFSHKTYPNVVILDAVVASLSFPAVYEPHKIYEKRVVLGMEHLRGEVNKILLKDFKDHVFIDGGLLKNYPIDAFDVSNAARCKETVGFYLGTADEIQYILHGTPIPANPTPKGLLSYLKAVLWPLSSYYPLKEHVERNERTRSIYIDTGSIDTLDFHLTMDQKNELLQAGWSAVRIALDRDGELEEVCPLQLEPKPFQPIPTPWYWRVAKLFFNYLVVTPIVILL